MVRPVARFVVVAALTLWMGACSDQDEVVRAPWENIGVTERELVIRVGVGSSSCNRLDRVETSESGTSVEVRAYVSQSGDGDCTADYEVKETTVTLDSPLGSRRLTGCEPGGSLAEGFDRGAASGCAAF